MSIDKIHALLLEALDYDMGPVPQSLITEAVNLLGKPQRKLPTVVEQGPKGPQWISFIDETRQVPWMAVIVRKGEYYGLLRDDGTRPVTNERADLVEFWDMRFKHDPVYKAQFVSRYYVETFVGHVGSLTLDTCTPDWTIDAASVALLQGILRS